MIEITAVTFDAVDGNWDLSDVLTLIERSHEPGIQWRLLDEPAIGFWPDGSRGRLLVFFQGTGTADGIAAAAEHYVRHIME